MLLGKLASFPTGAQSARTLWLRCFHGEHSAACLLALFAASILWDFTFGTTSGASLSIDHAIFVVGGRNDESEWMVLDCTAGFCPSTDTSGSVINTAELGAKISEFGAIKREAPRSSHFFHHGPMACSVDASKVPDRTSLRAAVLLCDDRLAQPQEP